MIANVNRDPKKGRAFKPSDFDPLGSAQRAAIEVKRENIGLLKEIFMRT